MGHPTERERADRERGTRILYVHLLLTQQLGEHVSLAEFGTRVAKAEGKETPYSASTASRWQSGEAEPGSATVLAMCKMVKGAVDPGWVMFGDKSRAPAPKEVALANLGVIAAARASGRRGPRG